MTEREGIDLSVVESISHSVSKLEAAVSAVVVKQVAQVTRLRRSVVLVTIGLILDLLLTLGGAWLLDRSTDNAEKIAETQRSTDRHLCAMYDLFLDSYNVASLGAKGNPDAYEESFARLEHDAAEANCAHRTRGRN